jgi:transcription antitermination factor NusG
MEGFIGTVRSIDEENRTAEVSVMWFGRETVTTVDLAKLAIAED